MNNKVLLIIGGLLLFLGLVRPNLDFINNNKPNPLNDQIVVVTPPSDEALRDKCKDVVKAFGGSSSSKTDAARLSSLYMDLALLVELDGENEVVKTTEEIRQANRMSGLMLRMNIKDKYPDLSSAANNVILAGIGDDIVPLDKDLRAKAVESFRALSWACLEASK